MSHQSLPPLTADEPLLPWLLRVLQPMSRTGVKDLLRHGHVQVNGTATTKHDHLLRLGDRVILSRERRPAGALALQRAGVVIVYEDNALVVIDKPSGLLSVSTDAEKTDTAFLHLNTEMQAQHTGRPFVVHRIDRDTSGLLMFARSETVRDTLKANWGSVQKTYLAVVEGRPKEPEGKVESYLVEGRDLRMRTCQADRADAKLAISHWRLVSVRGKYSLVEVRLETGRKHQIRLHMAGLGCPVVGDPGYGAKSDPAKRLGLHSWRLALDHPTTGQRLTLEVPLPGSLQRLV